MNDKLQLKNYPSGDPEFDKWFRETQPDWAKEIDAQTDDKATIAAQAARIQELEAALERFNIKEPIGVAHWWDSAFENARKVLAKRETS